MSINTFDEILNFIGYETDDMKKVKEEAIFNCVNEAYNTKKNEWTTQNELDIEITNKINANGDVKKYLERKDKQEFLDQTKKNVFRDLNNTLAAKNKALEELLEKYSCSPSTETVEVESYESKKIREKYENEERIRVAASEELPQFLDIIKKDFYTSLDNKILNMKEKIRIELSKYSSANLKIFLKKLVENENLKIKLIEYVKEESEKIFLIFNKNSTHFNILLLGKTGVGKSTLINGTFDFPENDGAKTGIGEPITQEFGEYISDKRKGLRLIDSKGIEMGDHNINAVFNSSKILIEERARKGDPDKLIHCIWYCFKSSNLRFEEIEKETVSLLMNQYNDNNLPIIIVITQNFDDEATKQMIDYIKKEFHFLNKEMIIMPVVAKEKMQIKKKNQFIIEKEGIDELIKISFEKSKKAILPAIAKSMEVKIKQAFDENVKIKKDKLKNDLKKNVPKILIRVKENNTIENNISKLSTIIKMTLNIIFEKENKNEKENENEENIENQNEENIEQKEEEVKENEENVGNEENENNIENNEIKEPEENNEEVNENERNAENEENIENRNNNQNQDNNEQEEEEERDEEINNEEQNQIEEINPEGNAPQNQEENQEQIEQVEQNQEENQEQIEQVEQNQEDNEENNEIVENENDNEQIDQIEISEKNKEELNLFLDDLCKWCIGRLNDIILDSLKENSDELSKLLLRKQETVKNDKNVQRKLNNEKSLDEYKIESEHNLKPLITKKIYLLAIKQIFNLISENLVDVSEAIMKEQFNTIEPQLRNYISDDKLKKISDDILEEIIKNN